MTSGPKSVCIGIFAGFLAATSAPAADPAAPGAAAAVIRPATETGFQDWVRGFRPRALAAGIAAATFDAAFAPVHLNAGVIEKDRNQNEFTKQIWEYLDTAVSEDRVRNGQAALARQRKLLAAIEEKYGVEAEIVTAIWGLESAYGTFRGSIPVVESLATLAYEGRRGGFFESQLIAALKILEAGHVRLADFNGSWAGAMGHTQFLPSSFWDFAQDFSGDGRRDLWTDDPTDALASTAAYLAHHGWQKGLPWGLEVTLPANFDYAQTGERIKKPVSAWTEAGVRDIGGRVIADKGLSSILLPAGHQGAAFLIFENFHALEHYNTADAYVIAVGNLADRIAGGPPISHGWPRRPGADLRREDRDAGRPGPAGHDPGGVDGIMGPNTIAAIRGFQRRLGLVPDGYGSLDILTRLREMP